MKIRTDFVTNSSSSSFVIARKDNCTVDDIYNLISNKSNISTIENAWGYEEGDNVDAILREIAEELYCDYGGLKLGNWIVHATEFTNEDGLAGCVIYDGLHIEDNDIFRIG